MSHGTQTEFRLLLLLNFYSKILQMLSCLLRGGGGGGGGNGLADATAEKDEEKVFSQNRLFS